MRTICFKHCGMIPAVFVLIAVLVLTRPVSGQTPMTGGVLRLVAPYGSHLKPLDPHISYRSQDMVVSKAFHRSLYTWDSATNAPALDLADAVSRDDSGRVFTYHLKKNVYFHNGRRMTADDVIWSYTRLMAPGKEFPGATMIGTIKGALDVSAGKAHTISGLKKIDDTTLEITFSDYVDPGMLLFEAVTAILPGEEVVKASFQHHPVGLGPFKFAEHIRGAMIAGEKFEKYYKPGKPYADRVEYTIAAGYNLLDMAFRTQAIDATVLSGDVYATYRVDPVLSKRLIEVPELFTRYMGFNTEVAPFNDKRVRQAFNYAVNRDLIISDLLRGKAVPAVSWLPKNSAAFDATRKPYPYDPKRAKALLTDAGYPNGFEFEVMVTDDASGLATIQAMKPFLEKIGIRARTTLMERHALIDAIQAGKTEAWIRACDTGPDPLMALRAFDSRISRRGGNLCAFKDPSYDAILDKAAATRDPSERITLLKMADAYIQDAAPVWFHNYNKAILAIQPWIHNVDANVTEAAILEVDSMWLDGDSPSRR